MIADDHVWFDSSVTPHRALTPRGLVLCSIVLMLPSAVLATTLVIFNAWPASCFVGAESALAVAALHWCWRRLSQQGERVVVTDRDLIVQRWDGRATHAERVEPSWVSLERQMHEEFGCEALYLRVSRRRLRIAAMVGATARAQLADALEAALEARKRGFARGAQQWISNEKQEKGV
jgi:uncharacterized membrane protein